MLIGDDRTNILIGHEGHDTLTGNGGDDVLFGSAGNDRLEGDAGNDTLDGGSGNDRLADSQGNDVVKGSSGDDLMYFPVVMAGVVDALLRNRFASTAAAKPWIKNFLSDEENPNGSPSPNDDLVVVLKA